MGSLHRVFGLGLALATLILTPAGARAADPGAISRIAVPNGSGGIGFDDLRFAPSLGKVLVPAGRTGSLDLVDPVTGSVTSIGGFGSSESYGGGHGEGVTSADEGGAWLFATDRTSGELDVVDPTARKIVARAKLSAGPDYVRYVEPTGEVWVTEPDQKRIEVFRLEGKSPVRPVSAGSIAIEGGPESLVIDGKRNRAYTHLWSGQTVAIDLKSRAIVATWPNGCGGSRGIALDEARGFLFVGCADGKAVVLDASSGKEIATASAGNGVDIIDYNAKLSHLYFPGGKSATMAIFAVTEKGDLKLLGNVPTAQGAHCVAADDSGQAYVCDPKAGQLIVVSDPYPAAPR
jgi:DNA-binding beta-propeller fold protein YncE